MSIGIWAKTPAKVSSRKQRGYIEPVFTLEDLIPGSVVFYDPDYPNYLHNSRGQVVWKWQDSDPLCGFLTGVGSYLDDSLSAEITKICKDFLLANMSELIN